MPSLVPAYFPELTDLQKSQFEALSTSYLHWNEKINVISRKDIDKLEERHILHSLAIAKVISLRPGSFLLDVGTGGGFPGIPLAILFPEVHFLLVDSIGKKIKVVKEIAEALELTNVQAEHIRMEKVKGQFDFVVSRAVAPARQLYNWTRHLISPNSLHDLPNGWLLLKGGDLRQELSEVNQQSKEWPISSFFTEDFFATKKVIHLAHS